MTIHTMFGGMTVSAIPDMARVIMVHGLTSTFRDGFLPLVKNWRGFRMAGEEVKAAGTALDMILDTRAMSMAEINADYGRHSKFERGLSSLGSRFGLVSLMAPWNAGMKQFSGLIVMTNILRSAQRVADNTATLREVRQLASAGIDMGTAIQIVKQLERHGEQQGSILLPKAAKWTDTIARDALRAAVVRDVDRIIITPGQDKPLWMSTELGKTIGQFRSFNISAMQRVVLSGIQQRDASMMSGLVSALALGAMTYWAKQIAAGADVSDNPAVWATEAIDKAGIAGWLMDVNGIMEKATRGNVGLSGITGQQMSRFQSRNVTGAFLGPTPDAVSDIFQVSGSIFAGDTSRADLRKMRQLLPFQNLFYLRRILNEVEGATGDALGLPERGK